MAMAALFPPAPFLAVPGLPLQAWPSWKQAFLSFLGASGLDDVAPKRKKQGQRIVTAFRLDAEPIAEGVNEFDALVSALEKHFEFSGCIVLEWKKLRARVQLPGETVLEFLAALRLQSSFCGYGNTLNEHLCETFLEGLQSKRVQDRILRECVRTDMPTLERAVQLAREFEQLARVSGEFIQRLMPATSTTNFQVPRAVPAHEGLGKIAIINYPPEFELWASQCPNHHLTPPRLFLFWIVDKPAPRARVRLFQIQGSTRHRLFLVIQLCPAPKHLPAAQHLRCNPSKAARVISAPANLSDPATALPESQGRPDRQTQPPEYLKGYVQLIGATSVFYPNDHIDGKL
ncbi:hypothetical protein HPB47_004422 [Ixodes persulcatus]|uniref:Uncharacterized protein n=1 Tax=Ixodes persulcatus TaxID=34615 RepID=A0AC60PFP0_IXOPE|nr:hypothetical protein HPB47_004422 [Ixodes persulcatus]